MSAGWFALGGVVIGGLINGVVTWVLGRTAMRANARAVALLVTEELLQSMPPMVDVREEPYWRVLRKGHEFGRRTSWDENRATLGYVLHPDAYGDIAAAYSGIVQAKVRAEHEPPDAQIGNDDGEALGTALLALGRGLVYLSQLVHRPPMGKPLARWRFDKKSREYIQNLFGEDTKLQAFLAEHGKPG